MSCYNFFQKSFVSIIVATLCFSCNVRVNRQTQHSQANAQQNLEPSLVYGPP